MPHSSTTPADRNGTPREATKAHPCPVCNATGGCSVKADGLILCRKVKGEVHGFVYLKQAQGDDQWAQYRRADDPTLRENHGPRPLPFRGNGRPQTNGDPSPVDWRAKAAKLAGALTPALRDELAEALGLPASAIAAMPTIGYTASGPHGAGWTFPELDGAGAVVGITCRDQEGKKRAWPGGRRGLTIPDGPQTDAATPLLIAEGPSCVLAGRALDLAVIGRPNNTGGVEALADFLQRLPPGPGRPLWYWANTTLSRTGISGRASSSSQGCLGRP